MTRLTERTCCTKAAPHPTIDAMPRDGETHYVSSVSHREPIAAGGYHERQIERVRESVNASARRAAPLVDGRAWSGDPAIVPTEREAWTERIVQLEGQIAAALKALAIPHPEQPYNAWVNSGNRWTRAAHDARLALGAEQ